MKIFPQNLNNKNRQILDISIIFAVAVLITLPIYFWGIPGGVDLPQHFQFAQAIFEAIKDGSIYPSWSADTNFGYGDPGIRFYPPLTYYILSGFEFITGNWYDATCLAIIFYFFISGIGVYKWCREYLNENSSLLGGVFYLIIPYHLSQIYQASMIAEFAGAAIIPFCFLYATRICRNGKFIDVFRLAISFGLLILTHLPTTVMASFALTIFVLFSLKKESFLQTILKHALAVSMSLLLSVFYWGRMIFELDWIKHNTEVFSSGYFSYANHFAFPFLSQIFGVELTNSNPYLNNMMLLTLGFLIPNIILCFINSKRKKAQPMYNLLAITTFSLFMILPFSMFVWEKVTIFQKIQFPWRWTIFLSLGCTMFVALSFETLLEYYRSPKRYIALITAGLLFLCIPYNALKVFNPLFLTPKDFFNGMVGRLKTAKSSDCWWAVWMPGFYSETQSKIVSRIEFLPDKIVINNRGFEINEWSSKNRQISINEGEGGDATAAIMYYPYWKAFVNEKEVLVSPSKDGFVSFPLPNEKSSVRLTFEEPSRTTTNFYISGLAWIIILGLLITSPRSKK